MYYLCRASSNAHDVPFLLFSNRLVYADPNDLALVQRVIHAYQQISRPADFHITISPRHVREIVVTEFFSRQGPAPGPLRLFGYRLVRVCLSAARSIGMAGVDITFEGYRVKGSANISDPHQPHSIYQCDAVLCVPGYRGLAEEASFDRGYSFENQRKRGNYHAPTAHLDLARNVRRAFILEADLGRSIQELRSMVQERDRAGVRIKRTLKGIETARQDPDDMPSRFATVMSKAIVEMG